MYANGSNSVTASSLYQDEKRYENTAHFRMFANQNE